MPDPAENGAVTQTAPEQVSSIPLDFLPDLSDAELPPLEHVMQLDEFQAKPVAEQEQLFEGFMSRHLRKIDLETDLLKNEETASIIYGQFNQFRRELDLQVARNRGADLVERMTDLQTLYNEPVSLDAPMGFGDIESHIPDTDANARIRGLEQGFLSFADEMRDDDEMMLALAAADSLIPLEGTVDDHEAEEVRKSLTRIVDNAIGNTITARGARDLRSRRIIEAGGQIEVPHWFDLSEHSLEDPAKAVLASAVRSDEDYILAGDEAAARPPKRMATEKEAEFLLEAAELEQRRIQFGRQARRMMQGRIDPANKIHRTFPRIKTSFLDGELETGKIITMGASTVGYMALLSAGPAGFAVAADQFAEEERTRLFDLEQQTGRKFTADEIAGVSYVTGVVEASIEQSQRALVLGRFGPLKHVFNKISDFTKGQVARRALTVFGVSLGIETLEEFGQEATKYAVEEIARALSEEFKDKHPGVDWKKEFEPFINDSPEMVLSFVPLVMIGAGVDLKNFKNAANLSKQIQDIDKLLQLGIPLEEAKRIQAISDPVRRLQEFQKSKQENRDKINEPFAQEARQRNRDKYQKALEEQINKGRDAVADELREAQAQTQQAQAERKGEIERSVEEDAPITVETLQSRLEEGEEVHVYMPDGTEFRMDNEGFTTSPVSPRPQTQEQQQEEAAPREAEQTQLEVVDIHSPIGDFYITQLGTNPISVEQEQKLQESVVKAQEDVLRKMRELGLTPERRDQVTNDVVRDIFEKVVIPAQRAQGREFQIRVLNDTFRSFYQHVASDPTEDATSAANELINAGLFSVEPDEYGNPTVQPMTPLSVLVEGSNRDVEIAGQLVNMVEILESSDPLRKPLLPFHEMFERIISQDMIQEGDNLLGPKAQREAKLDRWWGEIKQVLPSMDIAGRQVATSALGRDEGLARAVELVITGEALVGNRKLPKTFIEWVKDVWARMVNQIKNTLRLKAAIDKQAAEGGGALVEFRDYIHAIFGLAPEMNEQRDLLDSLLKDLLHTTGQEIGQDIRQELQGIQDDAGVLGSIDSLDRIIRYLRKNQGFIESESEQAGEGHLVASQALLENFITTLETIRDILKRQRAAQLKLEAQQNSLKRPATEPAPSTEAEQNSERENEAEEGPLRTYSVRGKKRDSSLITVEQVKARNRAQAAQIFEQKNPTYKALEVSTPHQFSLAPVDHLTEVGGKLRLKNGHSDRQGFFEQIDSLGRLLSFASAGIGTSQGKSLSTDETAPREESQELIRHLIETGALPEFEGNVTDLLTDADAIGGEHAVFFGPTRVTRIVQGWDRNYSFGMINGGASDYSTLESEYVNRWAIFDIAFGGNIQLEGVVQRSDGTYALIFTQDKYVPQAKTSLRKERQRDALKSAGLSDAEVDAALPRVAPIRDEEIAAYMADAGFIRVQHDYTIGSPVFTDMGFYVHPELGLVVNDARAVNFVRTADGIRPVDLIVGAYSKEAVRAGMAARDQNLIYNTPTVEPDWTEIRQYYGKPAPDSHIKHLDKMDPAVVAGYEEALRSGDIETAERILRDLATVQGYKSPKVFVAPSVAARAPLGGGIYYTDNAQMTSNSVHPFTLRMLQPFNVEEDGFGVTVNYERSAFGSLTIEDKAREMFNIPQDGNITPQQSQKALEQLYLESGLAPEITGTGVELAEMLEIGAVGHLPAGELSAAFMRQFQGQQDIRGHEVLDWLLEESPAAQLGSQIAGQIFADSLRSMGYDGIIFPTARYLPALEPSQFATPEEHAQAIETPEESRVLETYSATNETRARFRSLLLAHGRAGAGRQRSDPSSESATRETIIEERPGEWTAAWFPKESIIGYHKGKFDEHQKKLEKRPEAAARYLNKVWDEEIIHGLVDLSFPDFSETGTLFLAAEAMRSGNIEILHEALNMYRNGENAVALEDFRRDGKFIYSAFEEWIRQLLQAHFTGDITERYYFVSTHKQEVNDYLVKLEEQYGLALAGAYGEHVQEIVETVSAYLQEAAHMTAAQPAVNSGKTYLVFEESQGKSLQLTTGVPINQRFNPVKSDMRFSLSYANLEPAQREVVDLVDISRGGKIPNPSTKQKEQVRRLSQLEEVEILTPDGYRNTYRFGYDEQDNSITISETREKQSLGTRSSFSLALLDQNRQEWQGNLRKAKEWRSARLEEERKRYTLGELSPADQKSLFLIAPDGDAELQAKLLYWSRFTPEEIRDILDFRLYQDHPFFQIALLYFLGKGGDEFYFSAVIRPALSALDKQFFREPQKAPKEEYQETPVDTEGNRARIQELRTKLDAASQEMRQAQQELEEQGPDAAPELSPTMAALDQLTLGQVENVMKQLRKEFRGAFTRNALATGALTLAMPPAFFGALIEGGERHTEIQQEMRQRFWELIYAQVGLEPSSRDLDLGIPLRDPKNAQDVYGAIQEMVGREKQKIEQFETRQDKAIRVAEQTQTAAQELDAEAARQQEEEPYVNTQGQIVTGAVRPVEDRFPEQGEETPLEHLESLMTLLRIMGVEIPGGVRDGQDLLNLVEAALKERIPQNEEKHQRNKGAHKNAVDWIEYEYATHVENVNRYHQKIEDHAQGQIRERQLQEEREQQELDEYLTNVQNYVRDVRDALRNPKFFGNRAVRSIKPFEAKTLKDIAKLNEAMEHAGVPEEYRNDVRLAFEPPLNPRNSKFSLATLEEASDYDRAVESGDMNTAERLVATVAARSGYGIGPAYHGTASEFTEFRNAGAVNGRIWGDGFYFTESEQNALAWGILADSNPRNGDYGGGAKVLSVFIRMRKPLYLIGGHAASIIDALPEDFRQELREHVGDTNPELLAALKEESYIDTLEYERRGEEVRLYAQELGYDGIIGEYNNTLHYMAFDASQIKSADPITRDDQDHIVPLMQRFETQRGDMRYSLSAYPERAGKVAQQMMEKAELTQSGLHLERAVDAELQNIEDGDIHELTESDGTKQAYRFDQSGRAFTIAPVSPENLQDTLERQNLSKRRAALRTLLSKSSRFSLAPDIETTNLIGQGIMDKARLQSEYGTFKRYVIYADELSARERATFQQNDYMEVIDQSGEQRFYQLRMAFNEQFGWEVWLESQQVQSEPKLLESVPTAKEFRAKQRAQIGEGFFQVIYGTVQEAVDGNLTRQGLRMKEEESDSSQFSLAPSVADTNNIAQGIIDSAEFVDERRPTFIQPQEERWRIRESAISARAKQFIQDGDIVEVISPSSQEEKFYLVSYMQGWVNLREITGAIERELDDAQKALMRKEQGKQLDSDKETIAELEERRSRFSLGSLETEIHNPSKALREMAENLQGATIPYKGRDFTVFADGERITISEDAPRGARSTGSRFSLAALEDVNNRRGLLGLPRLLVDQNGHVRPDPNASTGSAVPPSSFTLGAILRFAQDLGLKVEVNPKLRKALGKLVSPVESGERGKVQIQQLLMANPEEASEVIAHEIGHFLDFITDMEQTLLSDREETTTNVRRDLIPLTKGEWKEFFPELSSSHARKEIRQEAIRLSEVWTGAISEPERRSRTNARELYADFISAWLNNREWVKRNFPQLAAAFRRHMIRNPRLARALRRFDELMDPETRMNEVRQEHKAGHKRGIQALLELARKPAVKLGDIVRDIRFLALNRYGPIAQKEASAAGVFHRPSDSYADRMELNGTFAQTQRALFQEDLNEQVMQVLDENGIEADEFDWFLTMNRIINERTATGRWIEENPQDAKALMEWMARFISGNFGYTPEGMFQRIRGAQTAEELYRVGASLAAALRINSQGGGFLEADVVKQRIDKLEEAAVEGGTLPAHLRGKAAKFITAFNVRGFLLNSQGITVQDAQREMNKLDPEKKAIMQDASDAMFQIYGKIVDVAIAEGLYSQEIAEEILIPNRSNYVPFQVLEFFDGKISARIKEQKGSTQILMDKVTAMSLQANALLGWVQRQRAAKMLEEWAVEVGEDFEDLGPTHAIPKKDLQDDNSGFVTIYRNGVAHTLKFAEPRIADTINYFEELGFLTSFGKLANNLFGMLYTKFSLGFIAWTSIIRDFRTNMERLGFGRATLNYMTSARMALSYARSAVTGSPLNPQLRSLVERGILPHPSQSLGNTMTEKEARESINGGLSAWDVAKGRVQVKDKLTIWDHIKRASEIIDKPFVAVSAFFESLPKLAATKTLEERGLGEADVVKLARLQGIPNPGVAGGASAPNLAGAFIFWRVAIHGMRAHRTMLTHPETKYGFWLRGFMVTGVPKLLAFAAQAGLLTIVFRSIFGHEDGEEDDDEMVRLGENLEEFYKRVGYYKKEMGDVIPLGWMTPESDGPHDLVGLTERDAGDIPENWLAIGLRIPNSEDGRFWGGAIYNTLMQSHEPTRTEVGTTMTRWGQSQFPGLSPLMQMASDNLSVLNGVNPIDPFRNRPIINRTDWDAGGWYRYRALLEWNLSQFTGSIYNFNPSVDVTGQSQLQQDIRKIGPLRAVLTMDNFPQDKFRDERLEKMWAARARKEAGPKAQELLSIGSALQRRGEDRNESQERKYLYFSEWRSYFWYGKQGDGFRTELIESLESGDDSRLDVAREDLEKRAEEYLGYMESVK